jgi:hypothetical protein
MLLRKPKIIMLGRSISEVHGIEVDLHVLRIVLERVQDRGVRIPALAGEDGRQRDWNQVLCDMEANCRLLSHILDPISNEFEEEYERQAEKWNAGS